MKTENKKDLHGIFNKKYAMNLRIRPMNGLCFCIFYMGKTILVDNKTFQVCDSIDSNVPSYLISCINQITGLNIQMDYINRFGMCNMPK